MSSFRRQSEIFKLQNIGQILFKVNKTSLALYSSFEISNSAKF